MRDRARAGGDAGFSAVGARPTRPMHWRATSRTDHLPAYGLDVSAVVALELFHRVATELLEERVGQRQRHHRLADDARRRHHAHVAPLVMRLDLLLGLDVDRLHRLLHRRDRLDGDAQVDGLAVGDAASEAARAVGEVAEPAALVIDLIVELGARPRRALEAGAELHTFDR